MSDRIHPGDVGVSLNFNNPDGVRISYNCGNSQYSYGRNDRCEGSESKPKLSDRLELDFCHLLTKFMMLTWNVVGAEEKVGVINGLNGKPYTEMKKVVRCTCLFIKDLKGKNSRSEVWTYQMEKILKELLVGFECIHHYAAKEDSDSRDWSYIEKCVRVMGDLANQLNQQSEDEDLMEKWSKVGRWYAQE